MNKNTKTLLALSLPTIILILAYLALTKAESMPPSVVKTLPYLPYVLFMIAGILAYRFNQSKIFYLALAFIIIQSVIAEDVVKWYSLGWFKLDLVYTLVGILIPLNLLVFSLAKERGIFSRWGFLKLSFLAGQFIGAAWIVTSVPPAVLSIINGQFLPSKLQFIPEITPLCLLTLSLGTVAILLQLRFTKSYFSALSLGTVLGTALLIYWRNTPLAVPIFVSSIGLIMIVYIVQNTYTMAYLDELTEIPGRRALREEMMKLSGNYVIAMVDIDFFKKFNDRYGHDVGDEVLRMVASRLEQVTGGGRAFRYGGEEFTIIFPGKELADVWPHLENVRENIAQSEFSIRGKNRPKKKPEVVKPARKIKKASVTVSIGAAEKSQLRGKYHDVLTSADKALYRAKKNGRNRVSD